MFFQLDRRTCLIPSSGLRAHRSASRAFFGPAPAMRNEFLPERDCQTRLRPWRQSVECNDSPWELSDLPRDEDRFWPRYPASHNALPTSNRDASRAQGDTNHAAMTSRRPAPFPASRTRLPRDLYRWAPRGGGSTVSLFLCDRPVRTHLSWRPLP